MTAINDEPGKAIDLLEDEVIKQIKEQKEVK